MNVSAIVLIWSLVVVMGVLAVRRQGRSALGAARDFSLRTAASIAPRLVMALFAASFLAELIPPEAVAGVVGAESGLMGILLASVMGGLLPGGPFTSFPIAVFLWQTGAGVPQMVALLAGWSVFAIHRLLAYELPMMGGRFVVLRMTASIIAPPLSGLLAMAVIALIGHGIAAPVR